MNAQTRSSIRTARVRMRPDACYMKLEVLEGDCTIRCLTELLEDDIRSSTRREPAGKRNFD